MAFAREPLSDHLVGDAGLGIYRVADLSLQRRTTTDLLPYLYADYGRLYARSDTFGVKTLPVGYGYFELAARVSFDAMRLPASGGALYRNRGNSLPIGIGTFQETPVGAIFAYLFHDLRSGGQQADVTFTAPIPVVRATFYPEAGVDFRSARSSRRLYDVSAQEVGPAVPRAYTAGASTTPFLGLAAQVPISGPWSFNLQLRREWLDASIRRSPLVAVRRQDTALLAITYSFK